MDSADQEGFSPAGRSMRGMSSELNGCHWARQVQKSVASLSRESWALTVSGRSEEQEEQKHAFHGWAILRDNVGEVNVMGIFGGWTLGNLGGG